MKTQEVLSLLEEHKNSALLFEYAPNQLVGANYHITEVKHVKIDAVDCGANTDDWNETIIQLWESPSEIGKTEYMTAFKALSILKKVGTMKPYDMDAIVKFEYSNSLFHTAQLHVVGAQLIENNLIFRLSVKATDCKAKDECGVPEPAMAGQQSSCCDPSSGCC